VPIPCFYDAETGEPLMDASVITHVTTIVREKGTDAWWEMSTVDLLPDEHKAKAASLTKGTDTMDVWFDSGSSWNGVVKARGLNYPADLYLEGSDQHRGWFQSSLLTSVAANGAAPYKTILTHGFVLDEKGYKMSKSLGNVVDPRLVIEGGKNLKTEPAYGADTLRLWVASADYTSDVLIGANVLKQTSDAYRKLRGTLRFLMGNVSDFDPNTDAVPYDELPPFDKYVLKRTAEFAAETKKAYEAYAYASAVTATQTFVAFLSNVFLDVSKDRLYVDAPTSTTRRAAQTVIAEVLSRYLAAMAPITPHTAEEAHLAMPEAMKASRARSVFLHGWPETPKEWISGVDEDESKFWKMALGLRSETNKAIEAARGDKIVGASLEAEARVFVADETSRLALKERVDEMKTFFIVSSLVLVDDADDVEGNDASSTVAVSVAGAEAKALGLTEAGASVGVRKVGGVKCARCWGYHASERMGSDEKHPELCPRCTPVVLAVDPKMDARVVAAEAKAKAEAEAAAVEAV
jgi:isoleucyl-tRNA synthetase